MCAEARRAESRPLGRDAIGLGQPVALRKRIRGRKTRVLVSIPPGFDTLFRQGGYADFTEKAAGKTGQSLPAIRSSS